MKVLSYLPTYIPMYIHKSCMLLIYPCIQYIHTLIRIGLRIFEWIFCSTITHNGNYVIM